MSDVITINLQELNQGSHEQLAAVFEKYYARLCVYAEKIVEESDAARDVVSQVFTRLVASGKEFVQLEYLEAFLLLSTRNESIDYLRHEKRLKRRHQAYSVLADYRADFAEYDLAKERALHKIMAALETLPSMSRSVMMMTMQGLDTRQIAAELDTTYTNVTSAKNYAIKLLRKQLSNENFMLLLFLIEAGLLRHFW